MQVSTAAVHDAERIVDLSEASPSTATVGGGVARIGMCSRTPRFGINYRLQNLDCTGPPRKMVREAQVGDEC
ncbi:hypothetical protein [Paracraurococcus lichenis]|uniref:Uncharacterized protein n=1 Tax=Paracraurococcus lichenis TaxID=3064888 RepID=A0ABT9EDM5_9PROT|nr:hypothetical protein [Paracraurococcus sp. LOR1-02]MDO9714309.1 hypothetical protein [Paracraurococcus sp. LOR1-02]